VGFWNIFKLAPKPHSPAMELILQELSIWKVIGEFLEKLTYYK
jgi:hypothetical protein